MGLDIFSEKTAKILSWIGLLLIVLGAFAFIIFRGWEFSLTLNEEIVGQFGDFIGGVVGTILAFVGVILYYIALTEQRKDIAINRQTLEMQVKALNHQIEEFKAQTKEMQETRTVYEKQTTLYEEQTTLCREQVNYYKQQVRELKSQTKISSLQQYNSEFYSLLNVFIGIKKYCRKPIENIISMLEEKNKTNNDTICNRFSFLIEEYIRQYYNNTSYLTIYFNTIYRLLRMIEDSNFEAQQKQRYAKTLRSQLSEKELLLLYYNYCSVLGEKVRLLAIKYNLFKHLNLMRKIELNIGQFENEKVSILTCLHELSILLDSKIMQLKDLENENDIVVNGELDFIKIKLNYNIEINDRIFILGIKIPKDIKLYKEDDITNLFLMFMYEYFFLAKLRRPMKDVFETHVIEENDYFEYKYKSDINNII